MSQITKIIGERIRIYRTQKKLSQDALGELSGLHGKYIGQLERGEKNATLETIEKICKALNLTFETLFENIITIGGQDNSAKECYSLILTLPKNEQKAILELIEKMIEYKNI